MPATALLIMDVQQGIVDRFPGAAAVLEPLARAARAARAHGVPVISRAGGGPRRDSLSRRPLTRLVLMAASGWDVAAPAPARRASPGPLRPSRTAGIPVADTASEYRPWGMHRPLHARRRPPASAVAAVGAGVVVLAAVTVTVVGVSGGGHRVTLRSGSRPHSVRPVVPATTAASTATTAVSTTTTTPSPLPPASDASQPQTDVKPTAETPAFNAEMAALWAGITTGQPGTAMPAFFPEPAYAQLKTYWDDNADWTDRLVGHFQLDIAAAHAALGAGAAGAVLTQVIVPASAVAWIPPGVCDNRDGYWHVGGSRLVYEEGGEQRSFGVASMISWRGYWYVVHLGSVTPPAGQGVVASPSAGPGYAGGYAGC